MLGTQASQEMGLAKLAINLINSAGSTGFDA